MKILKPKVELWEQTTDVVAHVARCARVCYGKENGNDKITYDNLIKNNHWSMFRHESVYAIIPYNSTISSLLEIFKECPYIYYKYYNNSFYVATNKNFLLDLSNTDKKDFSKKFDDNILKSIIETYQVTPKHFINTEIGFTLMRYTFCVITQISTSRELNRVSPNNIAEQSTRYVYEDGAICCPYWLNEESIKQYEKEPIVDMISTIYLDSCNDSFKRYKFLIESGMNRQNARGVLPLDTATKCVYTYSIDEWRNIIDLRYFGTTGNSHPNAKLIAGMIKDNLEELGYDFNK